MTEPQPNEVFALANKLLDEAGITRNLISLRQCNSSVFCSLFEILTGGRVPGIAPGACISEAVRNQAVVSALSRLLPPEVTLDHIHGSDLARGDLVSLKNLLDIFAVLLRLPCSEDEETEEDSNLLSGEALQIVDQVLQENLAHSCSNSSHSTERLLCPLSPPSFPPTAAKVLEAALPVSTGIYSTPAYQSRQNYPLRHSTPHKGPRTHLAGPAEDVCASYQPGAPPLSFSSLTSSLPSISPEVQQVSPSTSTKYVSTSARDLPATAGAVGMPSPPCSPHSLENGSPVPSPVTTRTPGMPTDRAAMVSPPGSPCSLRGSGAVASSACSPANQSPPRDVTITEETDEEEVSSLDTPHRKFSAPTRKEVVAALVRNYLSRNGRVRYPGPSKVKEKHFTHTPKTKRKGKVHCRYSKPTARRETLCEDVSDIPIMALVEEALPGAHCSPATARRLWQNHVQQQVHFVRGATRTAPTAAQRKLMDMEQQHSALLQQIKKDLSHARRMVSVRPASQCLASSSHTHASINNGREAGTNSTHIHEKEESTSECFAC